MRRAIMLGVGLGLGMVAAGGPAVSAQSSTPPTSGPAASGPTSTMKKAISPEEREAVERQRDPNYQLKNDWANMKAFQQQNAALPSIHAGERRVVFMGDSITQNWLRNGAAQGESDPGFFPGRGWVNRGISGQTTPQMLVRFRQDVIDLKPAAVVIFAGTNDIAGNTGDMTSEQTEGNLASMAELAHANGSKVIMCSITPVYDYPWKPGREPKPKIAAINRWIKTYTAEHGYMYVDFFSAMVDARGGLPTNLSPDGVHPNKAGYKVMNPLVVAGIEKALGPS